MEREASVVSSLGHRAWMIFRVMISNETNPPIYRTIKNDEGTG